MNTEAEETAALQGKLDCLVVPKYQIGNVETARIAIKELMEQFDVPETFKAAMMPHTATLWNVAHRRYKEHNDLHQSEEPKEKR